MLIDTHCHIHEADYPDGDEAGKRAIRADVTKMICVGVSEDSSRRAVEMARKYPYCYAAVGVHPHDTSNGIAYIEQILQDAHDKIVAIGEIGLDYFYSHSPKEIQITALEQQLQWATDYNLPVSFHVREAFDDFWPIFDNFPGIKGVLHSFTDTTQNMQAGLERGLYFGLNGISTFTKDAQQKAMFASIPLERMVFETDAPFLTPAPKRGTVNEPAFVSYVAAHHANIRGVSPQAIADMTSANAVALFAL